MLHGNFYYTAKFRFLRGNKGKLGCNKSQIALKDGSRWPDPLTNEKNIQDIFSYNLVMMKNSWIQICIDLYVGITPELIYNRIIVLFSQIMILLYIETFKSIIHICNRKYYLIVLKTESKYKLCT